jgi:hypothetical protein
MEIKNTANGAYLKLRVQSLRDDSESDQIENRAHDRLCEEIQEFDPRQ